jgi:hypothetical protein
MSKTQMDIQYEALNTELIRAMGRLANAVDARNAVAVDDEDREIRRLLREMRSLLRVMQI